MGGAREGTTSAAEGTGGGGGGGGRGDDAAFDDGEKVGSAQGSNRTYTRGRKVTPSGRGGGGGGVVGAAADSECRGTAVVAVCVGADGTCAG